MSSKSVTRDTPSRLVRGMSQKEVVDILRKTQMLAKALSELHKGVSTTPSVAGLRSSISRYKRQGDLFALADSVLKRLINILVPQYFYLHIRGYSEAEDYANWIRLITMARKVVRRLRKTHGPIMDQKVFDELARLGRLDNIYAVAHIVLERVIAHITLGRVVDTKEIRDM